MQDINSLKYIPSELKFKALWCGWKKTEKGKEPFDLRTDAHAKSNDPSTFCGYGTLLKNIQRYLLDDSKTSGIGLGIFNGYSAIDIDHCVDENGNISEMALDIITYCNSYTEYSPSKTGIRIIFKTDILIDKEIYYIHNSNNNLEIYISGNTNKFVTITGNRISDEYCEINSVDITYILDKYMKRDGFSINKVLKKDEKLNALWNKVAPGSGADESETDMALCCKLAYYLKNDEAEIKRVFEMSPYYQSKDAAHKKKWNAGYGIGTIKGAIKFLPEPAQRQTRKSYELNDTGNAHRFVEKFGNDIHYNVDNKMWMLWNGRFWQYDIKNQIKNYVELLAEEMILDSYDEPDTNTKVRILRNIDNIYATSGKNNLLKEAEHISGIPITNEELDRDRYLMCTQSGTLNLKDGTIQESLREDLMSQSTSCGISLDPPKLWLKTLDEIFMGNKEVLHYFHKALGYSISDMCVEQVMFILHSDGNSGKSMIFDIIRTVLGSYSVTSSSQLITEEKYSGDNKEEIARLKGKRLVLIDEIEEGEKGNERLIKNLTSGLTPLVGKFLYANSFEFQFRGKIWLLTNYEFTVKGIDKGIWRRLVKIPLYSDFTGKADKYLHDKLLEESPQILGWLLEGFRLYLEEGLEPPQEIVDATKEYRENMDLVAQWINERCECKPDYYEQATTLFTDFNAYSRQNKFLELNSNMFGRNMSKKFKRRNYSGKNYYVGIRLKEGTDDIKKQVAFDSIKIGDDI